MGPHRLERTMKIKRSEITNYEKRHCEVTHRIMPLHNGFSSFH